MRKEIIREGCLSFFRDKAVDVERHTEKVTMKWRDKDWNDKTAKVMVIELEFGNMKIWTLMVYA